MEGLQKVVENELPIFQNTLDIFDDVDTFFLETRRPYGPFNLQNVTDALYAKHGPLRPSQRNLSGKALPSGSQGPYPRPKPKTYPSDDTLYAKYGPIDSAKIKD